MEADDGETTPEAHAEEAPDNYNPPVQKAFTLQPLLATSWQDDVNSTAYHQAVNHTAQKPSNLQRSK